MQIKLVSSLNLRSVKQYDWNVMLFLAILKDRIVMGMWICIIVRLLLIGMVCPSWTIGRRICTIMISCGVRKGMGLRVWILLIPRGKLLGLFSVYVWISTPNILLLGSFNGLILLYKKRLKFFCSWPIGSTVKKTLSKTRL